jgi:hypothetical protein
LTSSHSNIASRIIGSSIFKVILDGSPKNLESILSRSCETSLGRLPVDDLPDILDVCGLSVEILKERDQSVK